MRLADIPLAGKILLCTAFPALIAGWLAFGVISTRLDGYRQAERFTADGDYVALVGDTIHALQLERGKAAGALAARQKEGLAGVRADADAFVGRLLGVAKGAIGGDVAGSLAALRRRVDTTDLAPLESTMAYSEIIARLQSAIRAIAETEEGSPLADEIAAFDLLSRFKNAAGLERAFGNAMIAARVADAESLVQLSRLFGYQAAALQELALGLPGHADSFAALAAAETEPFTRLRRGLLTAGAGEDLSRFDSGEWYALASARIDTIRTFEQNFLTTIRQDARTIAASEWKALIETGLVLAAIFIATIAFIALVVSGTTGPLRRLTQAIESLAKGDTGASVPETTARDEVGQLSRSVARAIDSARERAEAQRLADQRLTQTRQAEAREIEEERRLRLLETERALGAVSDGLRQLSEGNLVYRDPVPLDGAFDRLRQELNGSIKGLEHLVSIVDENADAIDLGSRSLQDAAGHLARRTGSQAAALEQAAAALEEVAAAVGTASAGADEAQRSVDIANRDTTAAGRVVSETVTAMNEIAGSSSRIGQIISVIDDIAFQTNLLALNAGVEAARAGDAGKGFAVVAQEVRELAQRSAGAAREIKGLIHRATADVSAGVALVQRTGAALADIEKHVGLTRAQVLAIARSAKEQATALAEISATVAQLDQLTQQNAGMAEETNAAAATLAQEAMVLREQLARFRTRRTAFGQARQRPAA